jgi:hypothetical protein
MIGFPYNKPNQKYTTNKANLVVNKIILKFMRKKYFLVLSRQKNLYQRDSKNIKSFYFLAKFLKTKYEKHLCSVYLQKKKYWF